MFPKCLLDSVALNLRENESVDKSGCLEFISNIETLVCGFNVLDCSTLLNKEPLGDTIFSWIETGVVTTAFVTKLASDAAMLVLPVVLSESLKNEG